MIRPADANEARTDRELEQMVLVRLHEHRDGRSIWKVRVGPDGLGSWTWKYVGTDDPSRAYLPTLDLIIRELRQQFRCVPTPRADEIGAGAPTDAAQGAPKTVQAQVERESRSNRI